MSISSAPGPVNTLQHGDIITIENRSGKQATLRIDRVFSSRVFITPLETNGIDLNDTSFLTPAELSRYDITKNS